MLRVIIALVVTVVVGLASVVATELLAVQLMIWLPPSVDASGNFFLLIVTPAVVVVAVMGGLVLTRFLRQASFGPAVIYPLVFVGGQFALLSNFNNPLNDRLTYLAITLVATVLVVIWRRAGRQEATA